LTEALESESADDVEYALIVGFTFGLPKNTLTLFCGLRPSRGTISMKTLFPPWVN